MSVSDSFSSVYDSLRVVTRVDSVVVYNMDYIQAMNEAISMYRFTITVMLSLFTVGVAVFLSMKYFDSRRLEKLIKETRKDITNQQESLKYEISTIIHELKLFSLFIDNSNSLLNPDDNMPCHEKLRKVNAVLIYLTFEHTMFKEDIMQMIPRVMELFSSKLFISSLQLPESLQQNVNNEIKTAFEGIVKKYDTLEIRLTYSKCFNIGT